MSDSFNTLTTQEDAIMGVLNIPITKAKRTIEVDTDQLPLDVFAAAVEEGLKVLLNAGIASKIKTTGLEGNKLTEAQDAAYSRGLENLEALKAGKLGRRKAAAGPKVPGVVLTEARRLAKEIVKNEITAAGMKVSHVPASDITKAANALIAADPSYIEQATANIEARSHVKSAIDIRSLVSESPKLVEADKAKKTLSAAKAGKVAPRKTAQATA